MEHGDISGWDAPRIAVVLEGVLAQVPPPEKRRSGLLRRLEPVEYLGAEHWGWSRHAIKVLNDKVHRYSVPVDVVTFLTPEVGESAAEWLLRYNVRNASCDFYDFEQWVEAIQWMPDLRHVVDSHPKRLDRYGIKAYETMWGGDF